ncbi:MAG: hypothetical protein NTW19_20190 [Planctomycetota bacterium]|nr:hypothetical protein [Planctomycetota bacterium]
MTPATSPSVPLFTESFASPGLPRGWYTDTAAPKYPGGLWDCRPWDGVIVPFAHDGWSRLRVEVDLEEIGPRSTAYCGTDSRTGLALTLGSDPFTRQQANDGGLVLASTPVAAGPQRTRASVVFEWTAETMTAAIDGVEVLRAPNIRRSARAGSLHLGFGACVVRRLAAFGEPDAQTRAQAPVPQGPLGKDFPLEVTVDFNDDLMACPWTHKTFDNLFAELKSWGTRRVSWIDLGRAEDAYFDFAPLDIDRHGQQTFANVGDIFATAVDHAHKHGLELVGILKPFDMAIQGTSFPPYIEATKIHRAIHRIGVASVWATHMACENQHLLMARKPSAWGPARQPVWTRIDLVKDDDAPSAITPDDVSLIVSDDNDTFRDYAGSIVRREVVEEYPVHRCTPSGPVRTSETRRSRVIRLEGLNLRETFVAIQVRGGARSFRNRLGDLLHVFGEKGEETHLTYGLSPRREDYATRFGLSPAETDPSGAKPVGPQGGFEYNRYPGSPSAANTNGGDALNTPLALDRGQVSYLALARGKDRSPIAVMSPSFPQTRALWMTWVKAMLDAGADGIDIRIGNHHADFAWGEYGFEQPVRDEMLKRAGADIWLTDDFDHNLWRRIRGEGWTAFMREASALTRARGKTFAAHIDGNYDAAPPPGYGAALNITYDWQTWLREGLLDYVTGKALWPSGSFAREVIALAHSLGVPVTYAPYCNNFFEERRHANHMGESPVGCHVPVERMIEWGRASGYDGFTFYECASALRAKADGTVCFRGNAEPLREVMRRNFKR